MTGSATKQSSGAMRASFVARVTAPPDWIASPSARNDDKRKKEAERRQTCDRQPPRLTGAARVQRDALAYRRSTAALTVRAFGPWAQLQARLPGTWQDVRSCTVAPTGEQRSCALTRALPAPACPSPGNAPPGPVIVPVSMMPEAARVRSVSFRPRAPHSLHLQEYPRPKASFTERDSLILVPDLVIIVNENRTMQTWPTEGSLRPKRRYRMSGWYRVGMQPEPQHQRRQPGIAAPRRQQGKVQHRHAGSVRGLLRFARQRNCAGRHRLRTRRHYPDRAGLHDRSGSRREADPGSHVGVRRLLPRRRRLIVCRRAA